MKATTIKVDGSLLVELERHKPKDQSLTAFVREVLAREVRRLQLEEAADRYAGFLARERREREWLAEWGDSLVTWTLTPADSGTHVHLVHDRFPNEEERDAHDEGWDEYFLGPLQETLESRRDAEA